jgi:hypothetical protein
MSAELRPRIKIYSKLDKDEILKKFSEKLSDNNNHFTGWAKEGYALISLPEKEKKIWTPQLNLQIDEYENGSEVRGVIGPSASVWTAFAFTFSILGFIALVSLFWGLSRLSLDYSADILFVVPVSLILIFGVYMLARIGQQLSRDQVKELLDFVENVLDEQN